MFVIDSYSLSSIIVLVALQRKRMYVAHSYLILVVNPCTTSIQYICTTYIVRILLVLAYSPQMMIRPIIDYSQEWNDAE